MTGTCYFWEDLVSAARTVAGVRRTDGGVKTSKENVPSALDDWVLTTPGAVAPEVAEESRCESSPDGRVSAARIWLHSSGLGAEAVVGRTSLFSDTFGTTLTAKLS